MTQKEELVYFLYRGYFGKKGWCIFSLFWESVRVNSQDRSHINELFFKADLNHIWFRLLCKASTGKVCALGYSDFNDKCLLFAFSQK